MVRYRRTDGRTCLQEEVPVDLYECAQTVEEETDDVVFVGIHHGSEGRV